MTETLASTFTLNNGTVIPRLGLGVYRSEPGATTEAAVVSALAAGYRHVDTARIYGNEHSVGHALRQSDVPREQVFVTTKLWNADHGYDNTLRAAEESLDLLGLDYVDLYLVHWPVDKLRRDTWRAMERLAENGQARAIGVSNYMVHHMEELFGYANVPPAVNQVELHPYIYRYRQDLVELCVANNIRLEAYSPLTKGRKLDDPPLLATAQKYNKSPAQLLIRWCLQHDFVCLPKSTNPERIRENAAVFDFTIGAEDMARLDDLNENLVTGWDPTNAP